MKSDLLGVEIRENKIVLVFRSGRYHLPRNVLTLSVAIVSIVYIVVWQMYVLVDKVSKAVSSTVERVYEVTYAKPKSHLAKVRKQLEDEDTDVMLGNIVKIVRIILYLLAILITLGILESSVPFVP